jgi:hypothetical protein
MLAREGLSHAGKTRLLSRAWINKINKVRQYIKSLAMIPVLEPEHITYWGKQPKLLSAARLLPSP